MPEEIQLGELEHIGHVVRDRDATMKAWTELFGALDWTTMELEQANLSIGFCTLGGTKIEILQPNDETTLWGVFLKEHGEGLHHLCYYVDDVAATTATLVRKGGKQTFEMLPYVSYVDIGGPGGFILELLIKQ